MADYRKQHWLPASYLMFFAIDANVDGRNSQVWVTDGYKPFKTKVGGVPSSAWTYLKSDAEMAEKPFHEMEQSYPELVRSLIARSSIGQRDQLLRRCTEVAWSLTVRAARLTPAIRSPEFRRNGVLELKFLRTPTVACVRRLTVRPNFISPHSQLLSPPTNIEARTAELVKSGIESDQGNRLLPGNPHVGEISATCRTLPRKC